MKKKPVTYKIFFSEATNYFIPHLCKSSFNYLLFFLRYLNNRVHMYRSIVKIEGHIERNVNVENLKAC
jgi:hypothetical protein